MFWLYLVAFAVAVVTALALLLFWFVHWLANREPYGAFVRLSTRQKLTFFRLLLRDREKRVPLYVKVVPIALVIYLSIPFDIIPDFVPVLGYLDDVAIVLVSLFLVMRLLPRPVVLDLLDQAKGISKLHRSVEKAEQPSEEVAV